MPRHVAPWLAALAVLALLLAAGLPALADHGEAEDDRDDRRGRGGGEDREQGEDDDGEEDLQRHGLLGLPLFGKKAKPPKQPRSAEPEPAPAMPLEPLPAPAVPGEGAPAAEPGSSQPLDPGTGATGSGETSPGAPVPGDATVTTAGSVMREVLRHLLMVGGVAMFVGLVMLVAERRRR